METYSPRHRVLARNLSDNRLICDLSDDIMSITTNKAYGRAFGTFRIILPFIQRDGSRYDKRLAPNDIISIELAAGNGTALQFVLVGLIDRVARGMHYDEDGSPHRCIIVSGRDFGKLLIDIQLGWDLSGVKKLMDYGTESIVSAWLPRYLNQRGTPQELIAWLLQLFAEQIPGAIYPKYINSKIDTDDTWVTYDPTMVGLRGTNAWSAMKRLENAPYNILTTKTEADGKFFVVLERTPINENGKLARSTYHLITTRDIIGEDIGKCDHERVNLLCLWPPSFKTITNGVLEIALAYSDTTRYSESSPLINGFTTKIIEPMYVPKSFWITEKEDPADLDGIKERLDLFWAWYKDNHEYESGSYSIHGRPEIQPGDGLIHREDDLQFLIEQVTHSYTVFPRVEFVTSLQVTRGQPN